MQKVEIIIYIAGDYVAFHEVGVYIAYDITNDIRLVPMDEIEMSLEEMLNYHCDEAGWDMKKVDAILVDGKYYYNIED